MKKAPLSGTHFSNLCEQTRVQPEVDEIKREESIEKSNDTDIAFFLIKTANVKIYKWIGNNSVLASNWYA